MPTEPCTNPVPGLRCAGLFAGIGGIELGLHQAGHEAHFLCESDPGALAVLDAHFPGVPLHHDVRTLERLPNVDLVAAGFPCQDLSQAGRTAGIDGRNSGLVGEVFRLLRTAPSLPWLLLENVPFMLQLNQGKAMTFLTRSLEELGFVWAYRTVDAQAFGLPQRRRRVLLLASRTMDPCEILYADDAGPPGPPPGEAPCGFYWTEGSKGLGWAVDAIPTLKGGSTIGIPSPPAIWMRHADGSIVTPDIRDAERLQGFPVDWTLPATVIASPRKGARWKLVGNAVSVSVSRWIGECLRRPRAFCSRDPVPVPSRAAWPAAAYGRGGKVYAALVSSWPRHTRGTSLAEFLAFDPHPLSARASAGFLRRARASGLRFVEGFLDAVAEHLGRMRGTCERTDG